MSIAESSESTSADTRVSPAATGLRRGGARRRHARRRAAAERSIPVRRLLSRPAEVTTDWIVPGDPIFSHLLATLSAVFPNGEDFFVASVRRHRDAVADDPSLKAQVKGFIGQEAMHGRAHRALNTRLAELGYHTDRADRVIARLCDLILRSRPRRLAIAVTAAAEHYTGLLGESALDHEPTRRILFGQESIEPLICWHALEELEHKNVAFDVMESAGGGYPIRVAGFVVTTGVLAGYVGIEWGRAVFEDRRRITAEHRRRFSSNFARQRLVSWWFLRKSLAFLRPGFHPDDTHTDDLVREWRARLADVAVATKASTAGEAARSPATERRERVTKQSCGRGPAGRAWKGAPDRAGSGTGPPPAGRGRREG
ncbi:MAG: metal-dependent hydrolase [Microthrixaceae bacterium]